MAGRGIRDISEQLLDDAEVRSLGSARVQPRQSSIATGTRPSLGRLELRRVSQEERHTFLIDIRGGGRVSFQGTFRARDDCSLSTRSRTPIQNCSRFEMPL